MTTDKQNQANQNGVRGSSGGEFGRGVRGEFGGEFGDRARTRRLERFKPVARLCGRRRVTGIPTATVFRFPPLPFSPRSHPLLRPRRSNCTIPHFPFYGHVKLLPLNQ